MLYCYYYYYCYYNYYFCYCYCNKLTSRLLRHVHKDWQSEITCRLAEFTQRFESTVVSE